MRSIYLALGLLAAQACGSNLNSVNLPKEERIPTSRNTADLEAWLGTYVTFLADHGLQPMRPISSLRYLGYGMMPNGTTVGFCREYSNGDLAIVIRADQPEYGRDYMLWLMFHEFGHCLNNLDHIDNIDHIMSPNVRDPNLGYDWPLHLDLFVKEIKGL
jgi:hypothetical protein